MKYAGWGVKETNTIIQRFEKKQERLVCLKNSEYLRMIWLSARCKFLLGEIFDKQLDYKEALKSYQKSKEIVEQVISVCTENKI